MRPASAVQILVFGLAGERYGVPTADVEEVLPAMAFARLPNAPSIVEGYIQVRGRVVPVVNFRERFGLAARSVAITDHLLLVRSDGDVHAFFVEEVRGIESMAAPSGEAPAALAGASELISGAARLADGLVLIHDTRRFLKAWESEALARAVTSLAEEELREA